MYRKRRSFRVGGGVREEGEFGSSYDEFEVPVGNQVRLPSG